MQTTPDLKVDRFAPYAPVSTIVRGWASTFRSAHWVLASILICLVAYVTLADTLGLVVGVFLVVPSIATAWSYGLRIGMAATFLYCLVNFGLGILGDGVDYLEWIVRGGVVGSITTVAVAGIIGCLQDLRKTVVLELARRAEL